MMRALFVLGSIFLATGEGTGECALNGAEAVDEMLDSAVFIWASVKRCGQAGEVVRCEIDISSAIQSVNGMINVILKAVSNCGDLNTKHAQCGLAAGVLTKSAAGLAAASGGIVAKCPNAMKPADSSTVADALADAGKYGNAKFGKCIVNVKDSIKSVFKAIKRIMTVKDNCQDAESKHCAHNSLKIVVAFAAIGENLAGTYADCTAGGSEEAECAEQSIALVEEVHNVGRAAVNLAKHCDLTEAERLYLADDDASLVAPASTSTSVTLALAAMLPISAVLSFVAGSRLAKAQARQIPSQDCEALVQLEE